MEGVNMQEVFEKIKKVFASIHRIVKSDEDLEWNRAVWKCTEIINQVAAEYNNGWIPCCKRLPEPGKIVMVFQMYSWENFEEGAMVTIGRLRPVEKDRMPYWEFQHYRPDFKHGTIMDNGIICPGSEYVIAWQPLPEPYQPKGRVRSMKCVDCQNQGMCIDHKEQPSLIGCTSGIPQRKKQTNADRIRLMNDEEMAEFILGNCENPLSQENDEMCDYCENFETLECSEDSCKKAIINWLQQEVEE